MILIPTLQEIVNKIVKSISPDRIIVLAYIDKRGNRFSIFNNPFSEINEPIDINLLVIANCSNFDRQTEIDRIEQCCKSLCDLAIIWFAPSEFTNLIKNNNSFAIRAFQSDKTIYQKWEPAPHIQKMIHDAKVRQIEKSELFCWYERSLLFSQVAEVQRRFGNYGMAAFCIHQAVEQLLIMLVMSATGYRFGIHNLDKMLRVLRFHNCEAANVFPKWAALGHERMNLLRNVYISYRYRTNLAIAVDDIEYYFQELGKLQDLADRIFY